MFTKEGAPILLSNTPSFQPNNLSSAENKLALSRLSEIVVATTSDEITKFQVSRARILQAAYVSLGGSKFLVAVSDLGLQLWSTNGENMQFFAPINTLISEDGDIFLRGISGSINFLAVGVSNGEVLVFGPPSGDGEISVSHKLESSRSAITATAASETYLVCANDTGDIFGFNPAEAFARTCRFPGQGVSCTTLETFEDTIVAGFSSGHVRIYRANINELAIEITAHARAVNGLTLSPDKSIFATCSDDQFVQVWVMPTFRSTATSSTELVFSNRLENRVCTGIAFLSPDRFAVCSYDDLEVVIFHRE